LEFPEGLGGLRKKSLPWGRYRYFLELHISNPTLGPGTATFCFSFSLISEWPANVAILIGGKRLPERGWVVNCSADNESPSRGPCG